MYKQLTSQQRYTIFACLQKGMKKKNIASLIDVHPSTVRMPTAMPY
ncbi:MAG: helix-turn-helix domain-containing protein [Bacteroidales bacterium]|nr:helix-turn-helix domain-containing protein [Bacteroidales bacterium]